MIRFRVHCGNGPPLKERQMHMSKTEISARSRASVAHARLPAETEEKKGANLTL
jgi:hypothetical protein